MVVSNKQQNNLGKDKESTGKLGNGELLSGSYRYFLVIRQLYKIAE